MWTPITREQIEFARQCFVWRQTALDAGYPFPEVPSTADISKSALLERLRSGKDPLPEPPPLGFSCPWYAVVEDPGPHYISPFFQRDGDVVYIMQHKYGIVESVSDEEFTVLDMHHKQLTSYRFNVWYDVEWQHPSIPAFGKGGWFMQNVDFTVERLFANG